MGWHEAVRKFDLLSGPHVTASLREKIIEAVESLDKIRVRRLTGLLEQVTAPADVAAKGALQYGGR